MNNYMKLEIAALSENEGFARSAVAAFALALNPTLTELSDIKTAVSEAVTNCVVHAYKKQGQAQTILIECDTEYRLREGDADNGQPRQFGVLHIRITDYGCGIADVERALTPFYTTLENDERSGMGFTIMQTFMDAFSIESLPHQGTQVCMTKFIGAEEKEKLRKRVDA